MTLRSFAGLACLVYSLAAFAQEPAESFALHMPESPVPAARIDNYRDAVEAIVWTMVKRFDLPVPRGTVEVYKSRTGFEQGLMRHLGLSPELARTTAEIAKAGVGNYVVLVNYEVLQESTWPQRIEVLSHELTHAVQLTLANQPGIARPQWLIEGSAEWMAFNVMDAMGLDQIADVRLRLAGKVAALKELPDLTRINTFSDWIDARKKYGFDGTYSLSFFAVDFLVKRRSVSALSEFFRKYQESQNYVANFRSAFGEEIAEFGNAFQKHLNDSSGSRAFGQ